MIDTAVREDQHKDADISPSKAAAPIRILLVDDHGIVRDGLAMLLERDAGFKIVGSVGTGEEAIIAAAQLLPDVIIMDLVLPSLNGIDATRCILRSTPDVRVIALSACHTAEQVYRTLRAGARGYVVKAAVGSELRVAVHEVVAGRRYISPAIEAQFDELGSQSKRTNPIECLSDREREVLRCVVDGLTSSDIARRLCLSRKTVDTYRGRMMVKLGVPNRSALIRYALRYELPAA
jgi:DNA-binding NarL/FixJ family response regulator